MLPRFAWSVPDACGKWEDPERDAAGMILRFVHLFYNMKKIIIVNNNLKVGGVQKSLCNLLWELEGKYDITLYLFSGVGAYAGQLPESVKVCTCSSLFRYLGVSQAECAGKLRDRLTRGVLAGLCRLLGKRAVLWLLLASQKRLPGEYDCAISFLHNGSSRAFYGGVNEFVLEKIRAGKKIAFLHCDYRNCGADPRETLRLYQKFDEIAACSDGCRQAFLEVFPALENRCRTVVNWPPVWTKSGAWPQMRPGSMSRGEFRFFPWADCPGRRDWSGRCWRCGGRLPRACRFRITWWGTVANAKRCRPWPSGWELRNMSGFMGSRAIPTAS